MKNRIACITAWLLVLGWMIFIFSMSAEPATRSTETSGNTIRAIYSVVYPGFEDMSPAEQELLIEQSQNTVRKLAHFTIYTILGILCSIAVSCHTHKAGLRYIISLGISVLYSISDEVHQLFVPGRSGQISDVLIDTAGALLGCLVIYVICRLINMKKEISK